MHMDPMDHPEIREWADAVQGDVDFVDFLTFHSTPTVWLAVSHVFWPRFVQVDGCTLWSRVYEPGNFAAWSRELDGDPSRIEGTLNRLKVWQIIDWEETPDNDKALAEVARIISLTWEAALIRAFPENSYDVQVINTEDGPVVTFHTVRPTPESRP